jgi:hypothetical protein
LIDPPRTRYWESGVAKLFRLKTVLYPGALSLALVVASSACYDDRILGDAPARDAAPDVSQDAPPGVSQDAAPDVSQDAAPGVSQDAATGVSQDAAPDVAAPDSPLLCGGVVCDGWCERPVGVCEAPTDQGICRLHIRVDERDAFRITCARQQPLRRLCLCDGRTFSDDCERRLEEVSLALDGSACPTSRPCVAPTDCGPGEFCDFLEGRCSAEGACLPGGPAALALRCDPDSGPVCGCDGKMYASQCARHRAGVSQAPGPPCHEVSSGTVIGI